MAEFKPMVKMMTTEPSVILKLKNGGTVANPKKMANGGMYAGKRFLPQAIDPPRPLGSGTTSAGPKSPRGYGPTDGGPAGVRGGIMGPRGPRGLMPGRMKKGGEVESEAMHAKEKKAISNVEKKLSKHEDMPASKGHKGLKTGGVVKGQGGYKTGGVVNGQGGYKKGGSAKKHYATGGVVDSGAPVAMPERKKSPPVAIDRLAGTFRKGGKVRGGMAC